MMTDMTARAMDRRRNVTWIEGLRGLASFLVIITHLARAFDYALFWPRDTPTTPPRLLQLPIIRVPLQGRIGVMIFAFLTGYVAAMKPLQQIKSGDASAALMTLSRSAFRRPPRLVVPASIALFLAWVVAQLHGFETAAQCDSEWLRRSTVRVGPTLRGEIFRLYREWRKEWIWRGDSAYDEHAWALEPLLRGAMMAYIVLAATSKIRTSARISVLCVLWLWYWTNLGWKVETFETPIILGIILCDLSTEPRFQSMVSRHRRGRRIAQALLIATGLYLGSYPEGNVNQARWSRRIDSLSPYFFPSDSDAPKRWSSIGCHLITIGIWLSPSLKKALSHRYLMWLGRNSFAVYLTHGTLMRLVLVKFIYGFTDDYDNFQYSDGPVQLWIPRSESWAVWCTAIPVWFGIVYGVAHLWTTYVDAWCARMTRSMEERMFAKGSSSEGMEKKMDAELV